MTCSTRMVFPVLALIMSGGLAAAGVMDGRTGPATMDGSQLDIALVHLNDHLQTRYAQDQALAQLDAVPAQDFVQVAAATARTPLDAAVPDKGEFGFAVGDGASLMLHLASFNEERESRGDDLFIRIARAEASKVPGFGTVARDNFTGFPGDSIIDDPTLDAGMAALNRGLREFDTRAARISQAVPAVTSDSFDAYAKALLLF